MDVFAADLAPKIGEIAKFAVKGNYHGFTDQEKRNIY